MQHTVNTLPATLSVPAAVQAVEQHSVKQALHSRTAQHLLPRSHLRLFNHITRAAAQANAGSPAALALPMHLINIMAAAYNPHPVY
jgi:hypothetical protein